LVNEKDALSVCAQTDAKLKTAWKR